MSSMRILHLSDFHAGKEKDAQEYCFKSLIEYLEQQDHKPDVIVMTGDLGNHGKPEDYTFFKEHLLTPLREDAMGASWQGTILAVPGNHDVDRSEADYILNAHEFVDKPKFFRTNDEGLKTRAGLHPRFKAFCDASIGDLNTAWVTSAKGYATTTIDHNDQRIGFLLLNTAWLCHSPKDRHHIGPGQYAVQDGLAELADCNLIFALGHHPMDWWDDQHQEDVSAHFGNAGNVVYLFGHVHKHKLRTDIAGKGFMMLCTGAAYQAEEDQTWKNGFQWLDLDLQQQVITVRPFAWNRNQKCWDEQSSSDYPNRFRNKIDKTRWDFPLGQFLQNLRLGNKKSEEKTSHQQQKPNEPVWEVAKRRITRLLKDPALTDFLDEFKDQLQTKKLIDPQAKDSDLFETIMAAIKTDESYAELLRAFVYARGEYIPRLSTPYERRIEMAWDGLRELFCWLLVFNVEASHEADLVAWCQRDNHLEIATADLFAIAIVVAVLFGTRPNLVKDQGEDRSPFRDDQGLFFDQKPIDISGGSTERAKLDAEGAIWERLAGDATASHDPDLLRSAANEKIQQMEDRHLKVYMAATEDPEWFAGGIRMPVVRQHLVETYQKLGLVLGKPGKVPFLRLDEGAIGTLIGTFFNFEQRSVFL